MAEDGQQQRKRRGRIGNIGGQPSVTTKETLGPSNLEPLEDLLADGLDSERSSGEMLMECVVKVVPSPTLYTLPGTAFSVYVSNQNPLYVQSWRKQMPEDVLI